MTFNDQDYQELYLGLQALSDSTFPKTCGFCGKVYRTPEEFTKHSQPVVSGSGLKETRDDQESKIIELFRNCSCGSTLMASFSNRRDMSETGQKRRMAFSKIQDILVKKGFSSSDARAEIVKVMRGEPSPALEKLGIHTR